MKKLKLTYLILLFSGLAANAQIISGIGIAGGLTYSREVWSPEGPQGQEKWFLSWNAAALVEFFHHPMYRWRAEVEYNKMGTKELMYSPPGQIRTNRMTFLSLNNYLKIMYNKYSFVPYFLIGPRVEYKFNYSDQVYGAEHGSFALIHVSGCVGVGAEMMFDGPLRPFIELLYNHDLMPIYNNLNGADNLFLGLIIFEDVELRVGIKFFNVKSKSDKCPPVYNPMGN